MQPSTSRAGKTKRVKIKLRPGKKQPNDPVFRKQKTDELKDAVEDEEDNTQIRVKGSDTAPELYSKIRSQHPDKNKVQRRDRFNRARTEIGNLLGVRWKDSLKLKDGNDDSPLTVQQVKELIDEQVRYEEEVNNIKQHIPPKICLPPGNTYIHGTTAIGDILRSGEIWGGSAAFKGTRRSEWLGGEVEKDSEVEEKTEEPPKNPVGLQSLHFFVAKTEENGMPPTPGNAFSKARQDAANRIKKNDPQRSWRDAGRPLVGILEFSPDSALEAQLKDQGDFYRIDLPKGSDKINFINKENSCLRPSAIRLINLGDAVRLINGLKGPDEKINGYLPSEIRVLSNADDWDGTDPESLLVGNGKFNKLVNDTDPDHWHTYRTADILDTLHLQYEPPA